MSPEQEERVVVRRADQPGDLGWVVLAHGEIYAQQLGWNTDFEALVARIVADYASHHDPEREAAVGTLLVETCLAFAREAGSRTTASATTWSGRAGRSTCSDGEWTDPWHRQAHRCMRGRCRGLRGR